MGAWVLLVCWMGCHPRECDERGTLCSVVREDEECPDELCARRFYATSGPTRRPDNVHDGYDKCCYEGWECPPVGGDTSADTFTTP